MFYLLWSRCECALIGQELLFALYLSFPVGGVVRSI